MMRVIRKHISHIDKDRLRVTFSILIFIKIIQLLWAMMNLRVIKKSITFFYEIHSDFRDGNKKRKVRDSDI